MTNKDITKIKVFGNDEDSLKTLGQLLSNETSRKIILCLNGHEMYINQISKACGIQMNLTIYHVKKLEELGLVTITEKAIVRKGVDHKFYKMIPNMFVNATQTKQEMQEKGFFKKIFKEGIKFTSIGIIGFLTFIIQLKKEVEPSADQFAANDDIIISNNSEPLISSLLIVIIGLLIIYFLEKRKR